MWIKTAEQIFIDMDAAFSEKNIAHLESLSHKFKGSCANMGAGRLSMICEAMEEIAAENKYDGLQELYTQVKQCYPESNKVIIETLGIRTAA